MKKITFILFLLSILLDYGITKDNNQSITPKNYTLMSQEEIINELSENRRNLRRDYNEITNLTYYK
jgi:hypothetical protein